MLGVEVIQMANPAAENLGAMEQPLEERGGDRFHPGVRGIWQDQWFHYPVYAQPHHTDYAGIVWHGSYLTWMEEARVEGLRSVGVAFSDLVALGCDLPVVELTMRYHQSVQMGLPVLIRTRLQTMKGVRIHWDYQITDPQAMQTYVTAQVTLVALDRTTGKVMRRLPPDLVMALDKLVGRVES